MILTRQSLNAEGNNHNSSFTAFYNKTKKHGDISSNNGLSVANLKKFVAKVLRNVANTGC